MNVTFGLLAAWFAFCLGTVGVKGGGQDTSAAGSDQFDVTLSLGATLVQLLRGSWPYTSTVPGFDGLPGTVTPNPNYNPNLPYGGGTQTSPEPPSTIVPVDPNQPSIPNFPQTSGLPQAGSVNL